MEERQKQNQKILTAKEVSAFLRIPLSSLWRLTKKGTIPGFKVGKHWRYLESDISEFFISAKQQAGLPAPRRERRAGPRIDCEITVILGSLLTEKAFPPQTGTFANIGRNGALFVFKESGEYQTDATRRNSDIEINDPVKVVFKLPNMDSRPVETEGQVIHYWVNGVMKIGIKFGNIKSMDKKAIEDYVG